MNWTLWRGMLKCWFGARYIGNIGTTKYFNFDFHFTSVVVQGSLRILDRNRRPFSAVLALCFKLYKQYFFNYISMIIILETGLSIYTFSHMNYGTVCNRID